EAEGVVGAVQVVVDGLGDAHHRKPVLVEPGRGRQRPLTTDGDHGLDAVPGGVGHDLLQPEGERIHPAGPEDRAAPMEDARRVLPGGREDPVLEEALPPVPEPHPLEAVILGRADDGADDGIETGAVAAAGQHGDSHELPASFARVAPCAKRPAASSGRKQTLARPARGRTAGGRPPPAPWPRGAPWPATPRPRAADAPAASTPVRAARGSPSPPSAGPPPARPGRPPPARRKETAVA